MGKKTKLMVFHNRQRNISGYIPRLHINGISIEHVPQFDFLGITLDENMTWKSHVNKIANKISRTNGTLNRLKRFLPKSILLTLYNTLILPHLTYGILVWGKNVGRLVKLQKWSIRIISGS